MNSTCGDLVVLQEAEYLDEEYGFLRCTGDICLLLRRRAVKGTQSCSIVSHYQKTQIPVIVESPNKRHMSRFAIKKLCSSLQGLTECDYIFYVVGGICVCPKKQMNFPEMKNVRNSSYLREFA